MYTLSILPISTSTQSLYTPPFTPGYCIPTLHYYNSIHYSQTFAHLLYTHTHTPLLLTTVHPLETPTYTFPCTSAPPPVEEPTPLSPSCGAFTSLISFLVRMHPITPPPSTWSLTSLYPFSSSSVHPAPPEESSSTYIATPSLLSILPSFFPPGSSPPSPPQGSLRPPRSSGEMPSMLSVVGRPRELFPIVAA